jgi:hypothetical protein
MNDRARPLTIAMLIALVSAPGCIFTARPRWQATWDDPWRNGWLDPGEPVVAQEPPPAVHLNTSPVGVGAAGQVWIDGHYEWINNRYTWIDGHWVFPPQPGWVWQQPAWHNGRWHRGYWHAPNVHVPSVYAHAHGHWNPGWHGQAVATPVAQPVTLTAGQSFARPVGGVVARPVGASVNASVTVQGSFGGAVATPVR